MSHAAPARLRGWGVTILLAVATLARFVPALTAARVDLLRALRSA